jgi:hypothetical protein
MEYNYLGVFLCVVVLLAVLLFICAIVVMKIRQDFEDSVSSAVELLILLLALLLIGFTVLQMFQGGSWID